VRKLLLVARHEYLRFARRKSFLLGLFAAPLFLLLIAGVGELSRAFEPETNIGYVDAAGVLEPRALALPAARGLDPDRLLAFEDISAGRAALAEGQIDLLVLLEADYLSTRRVRVYSPDPDVSGAIEGSFDRFVRLSLAYEVSPEARERLLEGETTRVRAMDGSREAGAGGVVGALLPLAAGFVFLMAGMTSSGYLLQTVSDEKENRTVEILTTSLSARQLILGKAAGLLGIAGTQLVAWIAGLVAALVLAARFFPAIAELSVPWGELALVAAFFLPAFVLLGAVMIAVGSAFPDFRQSQQLVAVLNTLFFVPLFLTTLIWETPDGRLAVFLTLFPPTSLLTVPLRSSAGAVPAAQLLASWTLLVLTAAVILWASPRIFRAGMLRYGQRVDLRTAWAALRSGGR
jgi:ABC-2 type transport system permease protein